VIPLRGPEQKNAITAGQGIAPHERLPSTRRRHQSSHPIASSQQRLCWWRFHTRRQRVSRGFSKDGNLKNTIRCAPPTRQILYSLAHNVKPIIAAVDGIADRHRPNMLYHCD